MIKKNQSIISTINIIPDIFLLFISYYISLVIRFEILNGYVSINLRESKFMVAFYNGHYPKDCVNLQTGVR